MRHRLWLLIAACVLILAALTLTACERERPAPSPAPKQTVVAPAGTVAPAAATLIPGQTKVALPTKAGATTPGSTGPGTAPTPLPLAPGQASPTPPPPKPLATVAPAATASGATAATGSQTAFPYKIVRGDTLGAIAQRFDVDADAILNLNPTLNPDLLLVGQEIKIPGEAPADYGGARIYVVRAGDTLFRIAQQLNVDAEEILALNPTLNPNLLRVGQELRVPGGTSAASGAARTYTVRSGDTLSGIARNQGVTLQALRAANNLYSDWIYVGQVLVIP